MCDRDGRKCDALHLVAAVERLENKSAGGRPIYSHSIIKKNVIFSTNQGIDLGFLLFSIPGMSPESQYRPVPSLETGSGAGVDILMGIGIDAYLIHVFGNMPFLPGAFSIKKDLPLLGCVDTDAVPCV